MTNIYLYREHAALWQTCNRCPLGSLPVNRPGEKLPGYGRPSSPVWFVAQNPAENRKGVNIFASENRNDRLFIAALTAIGIVRAEVFVTNAVKCSTPDNAEPTASTLSACRPWVMSEVETYRPRIVVAVGRIADRALRSLCQRRESPTAMLSIRHPAFFIRRGMPDRFVLELKRIADPLRSALGKG